MQSLTSRSGSPRGIPSYSADRDWREEVALAVRDLDELGRLLNIPIDRDRQTHRSQEGFPLLVPRTYLARIRHGDPRDPLLLQVLPQQGEQAEVAEFGPDPLQEVASCSQGWLQKYPGRILILAATACGVHCRFCFRRHFPTPQHPIGAQYWHAILRHVAAQPDIHEVILSGGDPLMLDDEQLGSLTARLEAIPHVKRLRIHTRLPVMIPSRVNAELLGWLRAGRLATWMVLHINHPAELDRPVQAAIGRLVDAGVPVLSQSVLLRGVNDRAEVLEELCQRLVDLRVTPYYLHQLDRVAGAAHFEVPLSEGRRLIEELRARLPGYAVPRYVQEVPGLPSKHPLA